MPNPVVHFEIVGSDAKRSQALYSELFGWKINADNPVQYGLVQNGGAGIDGGIAGVLPGGKPSVRFYVAVDDLQACLDHAVKLGCMVVVPPTDVPGMVTFAHFTDPDGNLMGLVLSSGPPPAK